MKTLFIITIFIFASTICIAQDKFTDSVFIRFNKLDKQKIHFQIVNGKIIGIDVAIKNKYENSLGFASGYFNSDLVLKEKAKIDSKKIVEYESYNEMLNKDFYDIYFHYHTYFIISEDKLNYFVLEVRPILPPELNKM